MAVLVKQVPTVAETPVRADGRLARDAVGEEMNPHCRRALAKGIELATRLGGTCTVLTLGPPRAEKVLTEALGCGADRAVLISDPRRTLNRPRGNGIRRWSTASPSGTLTGSSH